MPIIKSAKKRVKVAAKARSRNLQTRRQVREALKQLAAAVEAGKPAEITKAQAAAVSALDQAVKKNILHKNKAARFKAKMVKQVKATGIKAPKAVKKAPAKKVVAKRTTKPAARKTKR